MQCVSWYHSPHVCMFPESFSISLVPMSALIKNVVVVIAANVVATSFLALLLGHTLHPPSRKHNVQQKALPKWSAISLVLLYHFCRFFRAVWRSTCKYLRPFSPLGENANIFYNCNVRYTYPGKKGNPTARAFFVCGIIEL